MTLFTSIYIYIYIYIYMFVCLHTVILTPIKLLLRWLSFIIIISLVVSFSHQLHLVIFHWSLSDSNSHQVSRTLLSILAYLRNAVVWMFSILPLASNSSTLYSKPFGTVTKAPFVSPSPQVLQLFKNFLIRSKYLYIFSLSFIFTL